MDKLLIILCFMASVGMIVLVFPDGIVALALVLILSAAALFIFRKFTDEKQFVTQVFLLALLLRIGVGIMLHVFDLRDFFGADATTYDYRGSRLLDFWTGTTTEDPNRVAHMTGSGWGMHYLVAFLYLVFGKNIFLAQSFCAVFGAATAPAVYYCARKIFQNLNVAKTSALAIAAFPSFVIWSGQLMKDGLIIFLLVVAITMVLQLQERFNYAALVVLILSLGGIISLRFYIFYMVAMAVVGSFIIGISKSTQSILTRSAILIIMGVGLTYLGVIRNAGTDLDTYANLERIQVSRSDLANPAESGFGADLDVSTTEGALAAVPVGFVYLMFAPFPWEAANFRQAITIPEVLLWWAMIPLMLAGILYAIKHRLRSAFPILIFSLTLALAYSIFQGNVGTAYRQRTQIQVFLFIFIAVGWTIYKERREDKKNDRINKRKEFERKLRGRNKFE